MRRVARAAIWTAGLATLAAALAATRPAPPLHAVDPLLRWIEGQTPMAVAVVVLRLLAEAALWYLLALSLLGLGAALRIRAAERLADALSLAGTRRLVHAGLGLGVAAWSLPLAAAAAPPPAPAAPVERAPDEHGSAAMRLTPGTQGPRSAVGSATMRPTRPDGAAAVPDPAPSSGRAMATWTVSPGECFWTVAAELLHEALGRSPLDAEIVPYWRRLIETNRGRLVDPDDPDLVLPGQVLELPRVGAVRG